MRRTLPTQPTPPMEAYKEQDQPSPSLWEELKDMAQKLKQVFRGQRGDNHEPLEQKTPEKKPAPLTENEKQVLTEIRQRYDLADRDFVLLANFLKEEDLLEQGIEFIERYQIPKILRNANRIRALFLNNQPFGFKLLTIEKIRGLRELAAQMKEKAAS